MSGREAGPPRRASDERSHGWPGLEDVVKRAVEEDLGSGDVTTGALIGEDLRARAVLKLRSGGVVAGLPAAREAFGLLDPSADFTELVRDAETVGPGRAVARVLGRSGPILTAERVALNFLGHLSGIATLTARFVEAVRGTGARIYDTRKTVPGLREPEKYAVRCGGGVNHRMGLHDAVLVKDNHLVVAGVTTAEAVRRVKNNRRGPVEIEVKNLAEARACARAGADIILLDNFVLDEAVRVVQQLREEYSRDVLQIEISGGITLANVRTYAEAGADRISVGAITHSAPFADVTLDIEPM